MKTFASIIVILSAFICILTSCGGGNQQSSQVVGDTIKLKYAELLTIVKYKGYASVEITNPWNKKEKLHKYILREKHQSAENLPEGTIIDIPLTHTIPFTSVHTSLLIALDKHESIAGVADRKYIKIPYIQNQCAKGIISDVGSAYSPDIEKIITLSPDALLISPFENNGGYGRVSELGIPIIECADYMETSALGRAEWMKFYGMLYGASGKADSLFAVVDSSYNRIKNVASERIERRSVIMDKKTGSVWYVPGGKSTIGMLLSDANAIYPFSYDTNSGSLSLPFETVLEKAGQSDVWLFRYNSSEPITYKKLLSEFHGYSEIRAFKEQNCYGCNVETSLFYEESPFRPDYHLNDIVKILYPEIEGLDSIRYYKQVKTD